VFDSILVANRGEIAVRIVRTLRRLGIRSVAVYSDIDQGARHVAEADVAIRIGPASPRDSYLHIDRIIGAAVSTSAQAVHPGYGFLAENGDFARACADSDLVFIGPSPSVIDLMGDKIRAKQTVTSAGVRTVPGRARQGMTDDDIADAALEIGFPLLVKPSAGGGGKGMRLVEEPGHLTEALAGARREAAASFGDDTLFVEKFIEKPRHIEVQVFADTFGTTLHLGERECSLQRRHQKVMEESPSPMVSPETRGHLGDAAVSVARSVNYVGAGTVEFIVAAARPDEFYFMEMNTRLQVEHPVTELVTGLDLVEHQVRVAAGEPLGFGTDEIQVVGHAIEARIYAEDPGRNFLPTGGKILMLREPSDQGIRVDSGVVEGFDIATAYDPMLSKVIAWGPDRAAALTRLREAMSETVIHGAVTNISFLRNLAAHPEIVAGHLDTGFIERELESLVHREPPAVVFAAYALLRLVDSWPPGPIVDPWDLPTGWRPGTSRPLKFTVSCAGGSSTSISILGSPTGAVFQLGDADPQPVSLVLTANRMLVSLGDRTHRVWATTDGDTEWISVDGDTWSMREEITLRSSTMGSPSDGDVRSPMPGVVTQVRTSQGQHVTLGQTLVVVEAMKMEHLLTAPREGVVELRVTPGDQVVVDQVVALVGFLGTSDREGASNDVIGASTAALN
jgi:acetyl-CoA/propionyl-CoA carboxylase, biotin carboxylase, biotin carboxyl carrier protein